MTKYYEDTNEYNILYIYIIIYYNNSIFLFAGSKLLISRCQYLKYCKPRKKPFNANKFSQYKRV